MSRRERRAAAKEQRRETAKRGRRAIPADASAGIRRGLHELYSFLERTGKPRLDLSQVVAVAYGGAPSGELAGVRGIDVLPESVGVVGDDFILRFGIAALLDVLQSKGDAKAEVVQSYGPSPLTSSRCLPSMTPAAGASCPSAGSI